jgi:PAS domain S-box-containing protein
MIVTLSGFDAGLSALIALSALVLVPKAIIIRRRMHFLAWQLADTKLQLQMVLENTTEGIVIIDRDRNVVLVNRIGSNLTSVAAEKVSYAMADGQFEAFTPDGHPLPFEQWPSSRALRGDFVRNFKILHRRKDTGEMASRIMNTAPIPGPRGRAGQVIITYRDDSERQRVNEARIRLAAIVESSDDAIVSATPNGIVTSWNRGAEKMFGYPAAEVIGTPLRRIAPLDLIDKDAPHTLKILRDEPVEPFDTVRVTKDGRHIEVAISLSAVKDTTGEIVGISGIARDISATRALERQLHQSQKMEAIGQLTGGIAHDFNNLLGIVAGNLDLLEGLLADNEAALLRTQAAQKAAARCADLTRRLLAFSSKEHLQPLAIPLDHCVRNALEIAIHALGPEITLSTSLTASLPPVFIDPAGLESALLNLMVNARDAMPAGGSLKISTSSAHVDATHPYVVTGRLSIGSYGIVSVSDNGHGMSKETLDRVFEPFFTTKERGRGTGLGLAMVYGFARQSKGHVLIYSEPGHGATVSLYLPLADAAAPSPLESPIAQKPLKAGGTILLVDDELDLLDIGSAFLNKLGYRTLIARDAAHALGLITEIPTIDVLVTDIIMPGKHNGVELAHRVQQLRPSIKVVYTSGFPADALAEKNFAVEGHTLLNKPYRLSELSAAINNAMGKEACF